MCVCVCACAYFGFVYPNHHSPLPHVEHRALSHNIKELGNSD